jgi:hypothetical protein
MTKAKPTGPIGGVDPEDVPGEGMEFRMRLSRADVERDRGSHAHVIVELELPDRTERGEAEGVGTETVELRLAAVATLEAIHAAIGKTRFRLLGVKRIHAFDADVILVVLQEHEGDARRRFVGAVPVRDTLVHGAAGAVLDATNRVLVGPPESGA